MSVLILEDNEPDILINNINQLQIVYHPKYAPCGKFAIKDLFNFSKKEIMVIVDNNIVSPICDLAKKGFLPNKDQQIKVASLVTWIKFINATVTCGLGLIESDTAGLSNIPGEEKRNLFLYAINSIPAQLWKALAFNEIGKIPESFLIKTPIIIDKSKNFSYQDELHFLTNEAAIIKIVNLLQSKDKIGHDKFLAFMEWYADNLILADSIIMYAAMVFGNVQHISKPKNLCSNDFEKVVKGIKNQAWDITYLTHWSSSYYGEKNNICTMFATDDTTLKFIIANIIPPGECFVNVNSIFNTNNQKKKFDDLCQRKFGKNRIKPFKDLTNEETISAVKKIISNEYSFLKENIDRQ